jgi:hypothetical protein
MPASPPQITFQNGMLTISAHNSTLGDILRAVHAHTGAMVDVPPNATERVVAQLGPGPARDVLASLLNGSHFNYVMLGSASDPNTLDRLILTPKGANSSSNENTQSALAQPPPPPAQAEDDEADDTADTETDDEDAQDETQAEDGDQPQQVQPVMPGQQGGMPGQPNVRTPEQLLQELRNRQMPGQPGAPPGQPNPDQPNQPNPNQVQVPPN